MAAKIRWPIYYSHGRKAVSITSSESARCSAGYLIPLNQTQKGSDAKGLVPLQLNQTQKKSDAQCLGYLMHLDQTQKKSDAQSLGLLDAA